MNMTQCRSSEYRRDGDEIHQAGLPEPKIVDALTPTIDAAEIYAMERH
jgi:hypothetical protein